MAAHPYMANASMQYMADITCCACTASMPVCFVQNIAEWEMTDDDIEVAIKLADKSGDGRIDYDEFIAFVFGGDEPGYQRQTSTKPVLTEQQPSQLPSQLPTAPAQAAAVAADMPPPAETDAQHPAETLTMSSNSWPQAQEELPPNQLPAPQLPSSGLDSMQAAVLAARQQSLTDAWVAAHTADLTPTDLTPADLTPANSAEAAPQAGTVYDNELYQEEAPSAPQAGAAYHVPVWELENPTTSSDLQMPAEQPGDDVRLDIQTDLATSDHMQPPQFEAQWAQQPAHSTALLGEDDPCAHEQISNATSCDTQWPYNVQGGSEPLQMPPAERASAALDAFGGGGTAQMRPIAQHGSEPGGLQAVVHGDAVHFNMPLEAHELAGGFPESSQPDSTAMHPAAQQASLQQHATKLSSGTKTPLKAPRKLPALSYAQLSQGVNRSQAKNQQLDRKS